MRKEVGNYGLHEGSFAWFSVSVVHQWPTPVNHHPNRGGGKASVSYQQGTACPLQLRCAAVGVLSIAAAAPLTVKVAAKYTSRAV